MNTIKFVCDDPMQKKFAAAVRHNVNNYFKENGISTKGNFTLFTQTAAMLSFYLVPLVLILAMRMNAWVALLLTVIMGIGMAGIGMCVMP